jgi:hypothetical protein
MPIKFIFLSAQKQQRERDQHRKDHEKPHHLLVRVTHAPQESLPGSLKAASAKVAQERIIIKDRLLTTRANYHSHNLIAFYHRCHMSMIFICIFLSNPLE